MCGTPNIDPKGQKVHNWAADPGNLLNSNSGDHYSNLTGKDKLKKNLLDPGGVFDEGGLLDQTDPKTEEKKIKSDKPLGMPKFGMPDFSDSLQPPEAGDADKATLRDFRKKFGRSQTVLTQGGDKGPVRRRQLYNPKKTPAGTILGG